MISVLYVDDEPGLLEIGKLFLERNGQFSVDTITSAPAALALLDTKNYDAIISDFQMPEMDGIEFLKQVRTSGNTVPFILFTGRGREEVVIQALNEGADFYLQKGGDPMPQFTELMHKIRQAVQKRQADAIIRDFERRQADIINFLPDATFVIDRDGKIIAWNKAMELLTGRSAEQVLGKDNFEPGFAIDGQRRPTLADYVRQPNLKIEGGKYLYVKSSGPNLTMEGILQRGGKADLYIWGIAGPFYDQNGELIGAIESIRDVTRRKQEEMELSRNHEELNAAYHQLSAHENELKQRMNDIIASQAALCESEEKYRVLIENAHECIFIEQGEYLKFVNQRTIEVTGYSKEELLSRPFFEFIHPDDHDKISARYQRGLCGDQLGVDTFHHVRKDGVVRILEIRTVPTLWRGAPAALNLIMDITEQKKTETALRESEEKYRVIVESSFDGIVIHQDGLLVYANQTAARLLGAKDPVVLYGMPVINFVAPAFREWIAERIQRAPHMPLELIREQFRRVDGSIIDVDVTTTPGFWKERPAAYVTFRDITAQKQAEIALQEKEEKFRAIFDSTFQFTGLLTPEGILIEANQTALDFAGVNLEDIRNRPFWEAVWWGGNAERIDRLKDAIREAAAGKFVRYEEELEGAGNITMIVDFSLKPVSDGEGRIRLLIPEARDITERRKTEDALAENRRVLDTLMHNLPGMVYRCRNDPDWTMQFVSGGGKDLTGYDPEDLVENRTVSYGSLIVPEDRQHVYDTVQEGVNRRQPFQMEYRITDKTGRLLWVWEQGQGIFNTRNELVALEGYITDITTRKEAVEELRKTEERYRNVVEDQIEFICRFLPDGTHVFVNEAYCRYFGRNCDEILGRKFRPLIPDDDKERVRQLFESLTPDHPVDTIEHRIVMPDGGTRWQCWSDRAIFDNDGHIREYQSVGRDITEQKRAENEIVFKNILLLTQQETSPEGILIVDENAKIINFNKKFIEIWGIPEDLIVSQIDEPVLQFVTGQVADPDAFLSRVRYLYDHKDAKSFEEIQLKDGRILERFSAPMLGEREKFFGRVWYFRDITEQKSLENAIWVSQIILTKAMDLAHMANWELNDRTEVFSFDDRFYALYGTTAEDEGGFQMPLDAYFREFVHPDDHDRITMAVKCGRESSDPQDVSELEHRIIRRDGEIRHMVVRFERTMDKDSGAITIHGVNQDITERKRAEEALRESEEKYRGIFNNTSMAIFQTRTDGSIVYANPAFALLMGYETPEQAIKEIPDMKKMWVHPEERDRFIQGNQDSLKDVEIAYRGRDGSTVWGRVNSRILRDDEGTITGFEGQAVDITERKRAETALEQARKKLSLLNYVTFNDIQTMIFSLSAYMQLAKNPVTNMPIGNIIGKEEDILQKITHSLDFAKSYQDLGLKPPRWQNVNHVFLLAISHLDFLNMKHQVMPGNLEIFADPLLEQVFQILADNTLIHGKTATQVVVRYVEGPESLTLIFEDNGVGIPGDTKEKIFSPDFQKTRAIGLFLAREILEITGITIRETGEPGTGARFEMTVPKGTYRMNLGTGEGSVPEVL